MTREEAIRELRIQFVGEYDRQRAAKDMAIKALEQQTSDDCIKRSDIGLTDLEILMCNGDYKEALKMLLDKIKKASPVTPQPKEEQQQKTSDDCISRKAVMDGLKHQAEDMAHWSERYAEQRKGILIAINIISDLPSVTPQPRFLIHADGKMEQVNPQQKTGHWIEHKHGGIEHIECSKCHVWFLREHLTRNTYCPECGSYNGGRKNENNSCTQ